MDHNWLWRGIAIVVVALSVSACQTAGSIDPNGNVLDFGRAGGAIAISTAMPAGLRRAPIPEGFISFCMRFYSQCETPQGQPEMISLTPETWALLRQVNERINASIWPEDDMRHYGRGEYWDIPADGYGNCKDYALTKRKTLADAGLPQRALRIAIVVTPRNKRHAVLTVTTDKGDYVLDNLTDDVLPWKQTEYRWLERQDAADVAQWVTLDTAPTKIAAAAP